MRRLVQGIAILAMIVVLVGPWLLIRGGLVDDQELTAAVQIPLTFFTALAALAAWQAARQSATTAKDAREALGLAMHPTFSVWISDPMMDVSRGQPGESHGPAEVTVVNSKRWAAADVEIKVDMGNVREGEAPPTYMEPGEKVVIPLNRAPMPPEIDDESRQGRVELRRRVTITYKDENRVGLWRQDWEEVYSTYRRDGFVGRGYESIHRVGVPRRIG